MDSADSISQIPSQPANSTASSRAIPPVPHRRPRVREVSSRFMSSLAPPSPSPSSSFSYTPGDSQHRAKSPIPKYGVSTPLPSSFHSKQHQQRSKSVQRIRGGEPDPLRYSDENVRESEAQPRLHPPGKQQVTCQQQQRKPRIAAAASSAKLPKDKENLGKTSDLESPRRSLESQSESTGSLFRNGTCASSKRPDTPVPVVSAKERIVSSRYRLCSRSLDRSFSGPAANLLRSHSNSEFSSGYNSASETDEDDNVSTTGSLSEPNTPRVSQTDHDSSKALAPSWSSKLDKPVHHSLYSLRSFKVEGLSKAGNSSLPPLPCPKQKEVGAADSRKGRKNLNQHQEDMHFLKLVHNHYVQWRFINAK